MASGACPRSDRLEITEEIVRAGRARGLTRFRAHVLAENHRMLRLLARHTRILERETSQGEASLLFAPR